MTLALITGASAGIGREFARCHAAQGGDVILTARRQAALQELALELKNAHGVTVHVIPADLAAPDGASELWRAIAAKGLQVDIVINNAGFGGVNRFIDQDLDQMHKMVDLNIKSLMTLTHLAAKDMAARGSGRILNVGSTAGMIPGPLMATYSASKAFVNSFSLALAEELRGTGVTVTLLAPGPVSTEFFDAANMRADKVPSQATASDAASIGYKAMLRGKLLIYNERKFNFVMDWLIPLLPRRTVLKLARGFGEKAQRD